ncbi:quinoprotein relay system zinc metallohydrolase 2 [Enterovibrio sp. ZSDZ35]|uniref:Quinoprotein relay system zinc metallohydrolase 2 n=1 Tax=Enterovibrio qingdaonensis TaxID=2899818 RepID=A0ABT5QM63_9GAMM|nr:quinoprotein relay system zinc metallohydrolase 2 [Enterovibrio sp. ZSDZ35]MDD1781590.1 quinoprotein relay system zinc metallohydrolase 2 [Enterovibrio sp. ZSDZ35]
MMLPIRHTLMLLGTLISFTTSAETPNLTFSEVAPGVYCHQGEIADLFTTQTDPVANMTFIVGNDAVAVIDTGASQRTGEALLKGIRRITKLPITHVITTHVHPDHHFGNQAFIEEDPQFVAHTRYPGDFAAKVGYYMERLNSPWFTGTKPVAPTQLVETETVIDLGDRPLVLTAHDRAHTRHDLTVFDEKTGTLITGDLLFIDHTPTLDGSLIGWLNVTKQLEAMPYKRVIPGHGAVQTGPDAFKKQTRYLSSLAQEVRAAIQKNIDINTASETVLTSQSSEWKLFELFHPRNVIQAYKELEWE